LSGNNFSISKIRNHRKEQKVLHRKISIVTAVLFASLLVTPSTSHAEAKKNQVTNTNSTTTAAKKEKVKCKSTRAAAQTPVRIAPPNSILKRFPRTITLQTNCGDIVIQTFAKQAPVTITVMSALANGGFFNRTLCHRLTTEGIFVLQCGDPTATGTGGPNFRYRDENLPTAGTANYPEGVVAMANSGPNTNGSQFFLVYKDTTLGPNYTIWGKIVSGLEIVKFIAEGGVKDGGSDGAPLRTISIDKATTGN
jgi:peptidyl-prolyl cis-trans isomerase B (cyclophilin B)